VTKRPVRGPRGAARTTAGRGRVNTGDGVGIGDDLEDAHAAATFSAAGDVEREDAGEELCPADASGSGRGFGRVAGEGEVQRELWRRRRCGEPGDDVLAQAGEHAVVARHVEAGRRDQGAEAGEELANPLPKLGARRGTGEQAGPRRPSHIAPIRGNAAGRWAAGRSERVGEASAECPAVSACSLLQDFSKPGGHGWGLGGDGWSAVREKIQRFRPSSLLVSRRWGAVAGGDQLKPN
jgi:hypothetical protein